MVTDRHGVVIGIRFTSIFRSDHKIEEYKRPVDSDSNPGTSAALLNKYHIRNYGGSVYPYRLPGDRIPILTSSL